MTEKCKQVAMALCNADGGDAEQIFQATEHIMGCPAVAGTCPMCEVENYTVLAKAAIEAHGAALKAEGLVIVPLKATDSMMEAGLDTYGHNPDMPDEEVEHIWQGMALAALEEKE